MTHRYLFILTLFLILGPLPERVSAQSIPQSVPYTGSVAVNGIPFNGYGQFKFAIVNQNGTATYWSNDDTSNAGSEPTNAVTVAVSNGLYALELGNPDRANMQPILPAVFDASVTFLRVWFNDGVNGFQLLSPDRQLVSVPYAYRADGVSGTGTVVKSIGPTGNLLTDVIVLEGGGNVQVQRPAGTNTIRIVGTVETGGAVTDVACPVACIDPATEISGEIPDNKIPSAMARDAEVTTAVNTHAGLPNAHNLSVLAGSVTDGQIPANIARDSEVTAGVSNAIGNHIATNNAHPLSTFTAGTLLEARIDDVIARDSEVTATVNNAIATHAGTSNAHTLSSFTTGTLAEGRIDSAIARDSEVPSLVGSIVSDAIVAHAAANNAHALSSFTTGTLAEARIDSAIARVSQLPTWTTLAGIPAGFADGVDDVGSIAETDPQVGTISDTRVPKWSGNASGALVDSQIYDNGTSVGIGTPTPATKLEVNGVVTVVALAASYSRVVSNQSAAAGPGASTTLNAACPAGTQVLGGGVDNSDASLSILGSWPNADTSWSVRVNNSSLADVAVNVYAVCAAIQ